MDGQNDRNKRNNEDIDFKDSSSLKVIIFASFIIIIAVFLAGGISYTISKNAVVEKLKTRDLSFIAKSISAKIDSRISRAKETSLIIARDPLIQDWVINKEEDVVKGDLAKKRITELVRDFGYDNSFIVSALTNNYWAEDGKLIDVMSKDDPDDSWFYNSIKSQKPISVVIDYNNERQNTFAFINALMGNIESPIAVVGVGIDFKEISDEFQSYKFGENSNMWLVDNAGEIYISEDTEHLGKKLSEFIPNDIVKSIISDEVNKEGGFHVVDYKNNNGIVYDLINQPIESTDWKLIFQIARKESIEFIDAIKVNTAIACSVTIILLIFIFFFISRKISNPYKRAVQLSIELERLVDERTRELKEKNEKITDSIEYAKMIQESILPSSDKLREIFKEYFILWRPRDIVGGDFYYVKKFDTGSIVILGDCTGHGVPGALMTMAVNSILNYIIEEDTISNPALILKKLNTSLKQTLYGRNTSTRINDGLDIGILYIPVKGKHAFAGARISLYIKKEERLQFIKGNTKSVGYRDLKENYNFDNKYFEVGQEDIIYMTTDGFLHQNGGEKNFSIGRNRFEKIILRSMGIPTSEQIKLFDRELSEYMKNEPQRDDITLMGFVPSSYEGA